MTWYYISVFLHILSAMVWIGGMFFLVLVLLPVIRNNENRIALLHKTGLRFRTVGWITLLILLLTGVLNVLARGLPFTWDFLTKSDFGNLILLKLGLFFLVLLVSGIHDFYLGTKSTNLHLENSDDKERVKFRQMAKWSGRISLLLALAAVFIGVGLARGGF